MDSQCLECRKVCRDVITLHRHLKAHKMSQGNYYTKHFPRYDKLDGAPLVFKNREDYFASDFNTRLNLRDWLNQVSPDEAKTYVRKLLLERKVKKNLVYTPSQVELRSLPMPGMHYLQRLFGDYYGEAERLGFKNRFSKVGFDGVWGELAAEHRILIDTREQLPLYFNGVKTKTETLNFGDYKLSDDTFSQKIVIERKALGDFYSTLSGHYARFAAEIYRAEEAGFYMVVLVEGSFESVYEFSRYLKTRAEVVISPEYVFHNARNLIQAHPNLQFLFVEDREIASEIILKLFKSRGQYRQVDLQYAYDTGNLHGLQ